MFNKVEFIIGALVAFIGGTAIGYTNARAKAIELISKAALETKIKKNNENTKDEE